MRRIPARDLELTIGETVELPAERAHYVRDVLRMKPGARLALLDGEGSLFVGELVSLEPVRVRVDERRDASDTESPCQITLYQSIPKGDRFELILQKATELGATTIVPIETTRGVVRIPPKKQERRRARWLRIVESAARQCERSVIPTVELPTKFAAAVGRETAATEWVLSARDGLGVPTELQNEHSRAAIWIGPEGGFTDDELDRLAERAESITLGPRILRTETAAIAALTLMQHLTGGLL